MRENGREKMARRSDGCERRRTEEQGGCLLRKRTRYLRCWSSSSSSKVVGSVRILGSDALLVPPPAASALDGWSNTAPPANTFEAGGSDDVRASAWSIFEESARLLRLLFSGSISSRMPSNSKAVSESGPSQIDATRIPAAADATAEKSWREGSVIADSKVATSGYL